MKGPESYYLTANPETVRSAMQYRGDNLTDLMKWAPPVILQDSVVLLGNDPVRVGDWVLLNESNGRWVIIPDWKFREFWLFYETPEKAAVRQAEWEDKKAQLSAEELRRVDL